MGDTSKIQWTEATWNPWHGCQKVSPGCKYCYMYRDKDRYGQDPTAVLRSKSNFNAPLKWDEGKLIFTCSWSDFFIEDADEWRDEAWDIIRKTPQHTYQILTKRPERILQCLPYDWGIGYENVWIGVSVEDQARANERIPVLQNIPARIRFLSCEPLLGEINLGDTEGIHWMIIGGESGNETGKYRYRECWPVWMLKLITLGRLRGIPVFLKQVGTSTAKKWELKDRFGGNIDELPEPFQVRQMPWAYKND